NQYPRFLADLNHDSNADIVAFGYSGVWTALGTGDGHFAAASFVLPGNFGFGNSWTSENQYPRFLADVNHDNNADIVAFGYGGVWTALGTGDGHFAAGSLVLPGSFGYGNGWASQDQYTRMLGDVNGDGMADIIAFGSGGVWAALATGGGHFAEPVLVLPGAFGYGNSWTSND